MAIALIAVRVSVVGWLHEVEAWRMALPRVGDVVSIDVDSLIGIGVEVGVGREAPSRFVVTFDEDDY